MQVFSQYGYLAVAVSLLLQGSGVPLPGETILLGGGFLAHHGELAFIPLLVIASVASFLGQMVGYEIGRRWGRPIVARLGRYAFLTPDRLAQLDELFLRHGERTILFSRFWAVTRAYAGLFAGMTGLSFRRFLLFNAAGCVMWAVVVGGLGFLFGSSWEHVLNAAKWLAFAVAAVVAGVVIALVLRWRRAHRRSPGSSSPLDV